MAETNLKEDQVHFAAPHCLVVLGLEHLQPIGELLETCNWFIDLGSVKVSILTFLSWKTKLK